MADRARKPRLATHRTGAAEIGQIGFSSRRVFLVIRINPSVKAQVTGELIDIKGIFDGVDTKSITPLKATIARRTASRSSPFTR